MEFLPEWVFAPFIGKPVWAWLMFLAIVLALLVFDLGFLGRRDRQADGRIIGVRESLWLSSFYIAIAVLYGGFVWYRFGGESGMDYFTGYLLEKSLAMDNIFVISLVFAYFRVPRRYQHRVLFWGILGVLILRAIFIGLGAALVNNFDWVLLIFGAFLLFTGIRMLHTGGEPPRIEGNPLLQFLLRHLRVTKDVRGQRFFVREQTAEGVRWLATPLFVALLMVEGADIIFAVDSVPAIFGITTDPFVVYTSNIFAVLGLRALYFTIAALLERFRYLDYALSAVLIFIGLKIFYDEFVGHVPAGVSLAVTLLLLGGGMLVSLLRAAREEPQQGD